MHKTKKAFSLVELIVSVSIIGLILSVVFWNYGDFNDNLALSAAAQEMAIAVREAQTYGINVKEAPSGGVFDYSYGIHFSLASGNTTSFRLFVDLDRDNQFDVGSGCTGILECISKVDLRNGVYVSNICDSTTCPPSGAQRINIIFKRPNPDANIYFADSSLNNILGPVSTAKVELTSPKGKKKYVIIEKTGQVTIQ